MEALVLDKQRALALSARCEVNQGNCTNYLKLSKPSLGAIHVPIPDHTTSAVLVRVKDDR